MKRTPVVLVGFIAILATLLLATFTSPFLIHLFVPTTPLTDSTSVVASPDFSDLQIVNTRLHDANGNGKIDGISVVFSLFVEFPQLGVNAIEFNGKLILISNDTSSLLLTEIDSYPFPSSKIEFQDPGVNKFVTAELFFPFQNSPFLIRDPKEIMGPEIDSLRFQAKLSIFATFVRPPLSIQLTILENREMQEIGLIEIEMLDPVFAVQEVSREGTNGLNVLTFRGIVEPRFSLSSLSAWLIPMPIVVPPSALFLKEENDSNLLISQTTPIKEPYEAIPIQIQNSSFSVEIPFGEITQLITYALSGTPGDALVLFPLYAIMETVYSGKNLYLNTALKLSVPLDKIKSEITSSILQSPKKKAEITLTPLDKDNNTAYETIRITVQAFNSTYPMVMLTVLGIPIPIVLPKTKSNQNISIYSGEFPSSWFFSKVSYGSSSDPLIAPFMVTQIDALYKDGIPAETIDSLPAFVLESWEATSVEILSINKPTFSPSLGFLEFSTTITIYSSVATTLFARVGPQTSEGRSSSSIFPLRVTPIQLQPGVHDYPLRMIFPLISSSQIESEGVSEQFHISFDLRTLLGARSLLPPVSLGTVNVRGQSFRSTNDVYFNSLPSIGKSSSLEYQLTLYPSNFTISFGLQVPSTPKDFVSQRMTYSFEGELLPIYHYVSTSKFLQLTFAENAFNLFFATVNDTFVTRSFLRTIDNGTVLLRPSNILGSWLDITTPFSWNPFFLPDVAVSDIYLAEWGSPSFGVVVEKTTITLSDGSKHSVLRVEDTEGFTRYYDATNRYLVKLVYDEFVLELVKSSFSVGSLLSRDNGSQLLKLFLFSLIGLAILSWIIRDVRALLIQRKGKMLATDFLE